MYPEGAKDKVNPGVQRSKAMDAFICYGPVLKKNKCHIFQQLDGDNENHLFVSGKQRLFCWWMLKNKQRWAALNDLFTNDTRRHFAFEDDISDQCSICL